MLAAIAAELSDSCTIERPTRTLDGIGGYTSAWSVRADNVPCRIELDIRAREYVDADRIGGRAVYTLHILPSQHIELSDRVILNSEIYEVVGTGSISSESPARPIYLARSME